MPSRWTLAALPVLLGAAHAACTSTTVEPADDDAGSGAASTVNTTTTASGGAGGAGATTTTSSAMGGAGGAGNAGGRGGEGGLDWSEPPLHLEERCLGEAVIGQFKDFDIPPNTFGFTIVARAPNQDTLIGIERLRPGGNGSVIASFDVPGKDFDPFVDVGTISGANPQADHADAWPMFIGEWRVRYGDDGAGAPVEVCVFARRSEDGLPHGGVMDINVRIAPAAGVDAAYMQNVLNALFANHYGPAIGVGVGTITMDSLAATYDTVDSYAEYNDMLRSSAGIGSRPAVNLFVVGNFANSAFNNAVGVAGGIPGSTVIHGTSQSGVAYQPSGDVAYDAAVLAHEIGHLGGLWHTTEIAITETDPLSDTPECADIGNDPNGCPDANNVMFPIAYSGSELTQDQAMVLAGSALYRGSLVAGGPPGPPIAESTAAAAAGAPPRLHGSAPAATTLPLVTRRLPADDIERILSSVWCGHGGTDHVALVGRLATVARLLEIALDADAFDVARGRAIAAAHHIAVAHSDRAALAEVIVVAGRIVRASTHRRHVVLAAIDVLAQRAAPELARVAPALHRRGDRLVAERLRALGL